MRHLVRLLAFLTVMVGMAYAVVPPSIAPLPPTVYGPPIATNPSGSAPGTKIHSDITTDIGIIIDDANRVAYRSWWINHPFVQESLPLIKDALEKTGHALPENWDGAVGFYDWISTNLEDIWDAWAESPEGTYPELDDQFTPYKAPPAAAEPWPVGTYYKAFGGSGYFKRNTGWSEYQTVSAQGEHLPCTIEPGPDNEGVRVGFPGVTQVTGPFLDAYWTKYGGLPTSNTNLSVFCWGLTRVGYNYMGINASSYTYYPTWNLAGDPPDERPIPAPGVPNIPGLKDALSEPGAATNPDLKDALGELLKDNPGIWDQNTGLTAAQLAKILKDAQAGIANTAVQAALDALAADPTNAALQQAAADAISAANQAALDQLEEVEPETTPVALPDIGTVTRKELDFSALAPIMGTACLTADCPFPFDFMSVLMASFDSLKTPVSAMPDPSGEYGTENFKINFNFDFSRFTAIAEKIRLLLEWIFILTTILKCVRIVVGDNASTEDN